MTRRERAALLAELLAERYGPPVPAPGWEPDVDPDVYQRRRRLLVQALNRRPGEDDGECWVAW